MDQRFRDKMRAFEASMQLKDLKAGDTVTEIHLAAINHFLGDLLTAARSVPLREAVIEFRDGQPVITKDELGIKEIKMNL